mgnify:CR=1 FL=1
MSKPVRIETPSGNVYISFISRYRDETDLQVSFVKPGYSTSTTVSVKDDGGVLGEMPSVIPDMTALIRDFYKKVAPGKHAVETLHS